MSEKICRYNKDEFCVNDQCPMCADYCPVPDTPGICMHEDRMEECFIVTPKDCLTVALRHNGFHDITDEQIDIVFKDFAEYMKKNGYIQIPEREQNEIDSFRIKEFNVGQRVSIDDIQSSKEWALTDDCCNGSYVRLTYTSIDKLLIVVFDDGKWGTVMFNRVPSENK